MTQNTCIRVFADPVQIRECRKRVKAKHPAFSRLSSVMSLVGNEVRLKILYLLDSEQELCPCDLSDILQMTIPAISQHLRKMKDGGLIEARRVGQTIFYSIQKESSDIILPIFRQVDRLSKKQKLV
ncbi:MAG: metalloregulator ArsR/SmtB family transcription factor [Cyclobacteriaceae bacterium]